MSDDFMRNTDDAPISPECEVVDARLADYLDDAPDPAVVAEVDAHLADCPRCAALVADLTGIASAARALPPLAPSRDLWAGIAERIDAAPIVVPIETARRTRTRTFAMPARWRSLGAAAAALVLVTAGVTYEVTKVFASRDSLHVATVDNTNGRPTPIGPPAAPTEVVSADGQRPPTTSAGSDALRDGSASSAATNPSGASLVAHRNKPTTVAMKSGYDVEIDKLRRIVRERRSDLDSGTVAVLDRNLKVIDEAIAQSRAALAHDPRSRFLDEQLNKALDKKIELLRTAALLPART